MSSDKKSEAFPGRNFYQGSGVNWSRFLPWLLSVFVVAGVLAEGLFLLFHAGHYYVIIMPVVAALAVGGLVSLAVNQGHCRNQLVAGAAGFCAGLVLYLGSYYCGMIYHLGPEASGRLDWLSHYIRLRMETDVTHNTYDTDRDSKRKRSGNLYVNWGRFGIELILVLGLTTAAGIKRSRKSYCQQCRRWMERELTPFEPAESAGLLEVLRNGAARSLAALCAKAAYSTVPNTTLAVEYCPTFKEGMTRDCPVYVYVKSITAVPPNAIRDSFEQSKGKILVRGLQLNPDEIPALAPRFRLFETQFGRSAVSALLPQDEPAATTADKDVVYAEIQPLGPDHAGKIMTRKTVLIGNAFALFGLIGIFGGIGFLVWGGMTAFPDHPPEDGISPTTKEIGIALMILGGLLACSALVGMVTDTSFLGNRYLRKLLHREIARRTSVQVEPADPDALFVEIVPKLNWGKMMLENASDVGLLLLDRSKRELRFEGDNERWRIPASAITHCEVEEFVYRQGEGKTRRYYVVLRANHRNGFWEAPVRERGGSGMRSGQQKKKARRLYESIQEIRGIQPMAGRW